MTKKITQLALTFFLIFVVGCGGGTDTAGNGSGNSNVVDQIANRTNIDGDDGNRQSRDRSGRNGGDSASSSAGSGNKNENGDGSNNVSQPDPTAFDSAIFPSVAVGGGALASDSDFGGALFPGKNSPESQEPDEEPEPQADRGRSDGSAMGLAGSQSDRSNRRGAPRGDVANNRGDEAENPEETDEPEEEAPLSLLAEAKRRFIKHEEEQGINLLYAYHLVDDEARSNYSLNWYKGLKEPRMLLRLGVGVVYNAPKDFEGRHPVIGDPGDPNEGASSNQNSGRGRGRGGRDSPGPVGLGGGGGGRRASRGSRAFKNVDTSRPDGFLLYYTGEFGESVVRELDNRRKGGNAAYGQLLKDVMEVELPKDEQEEQQASNRGGRRGGNPGAAASIGALSGRGGNRGRGGNSQEDEEDEDTSVLDQALGRGTAQKPDDEEFTGTIRPGVLLLGVGNKKSLLERAKAAKVDTLITFNVKITESRRGPTTNTTSVRVVDMKGKNDQLFGTKSLKDTTVEEKKDDGDDPLEKEVERLFARMDGDFSAGPLPSAINAENVKKRIGRLLKNSTDNPLPAAVEIVAFSGKEVIDPRTCQNRDGPIIRF